MNTPTPTPRTDAATYPADCLGATLVTNRDLARALETELAALTAEREQLRAENATLRAAQKACEACDEPTAFEVRQLRAEVERLKKHCANLENDVAHLSEGVSEGDPLFMAVARAERADADLATERARFDWVFRNCKVTSDGYPVHDREDLGVAMKKDAK